ncbi:hypothetical protein D9758_013722 [Tetrapyrgos nigripes]|uniref:CFEM domain-containing protein n=1 Tax=Tetrapyrgos nigripes TaxID=182062 RepID=A0A8H5G1P8_9AGAR|nr:hypothetical protein D9758_013722 [Tetrapyrgos nigripes]
MFSGKLVLLFSVAILAVNAQDSSTPSPTDSNDGFSTVSPSLSDCETSCFRQSLSGSSCTDVTDFRCICTDTIQTDVAACIKSNCSDQVAGSLVQQQLHCAAISISSSIGSDTDSSSTGGTVTGNSSTGNSGTGNTGFKSSAIPSGTSATNSISRSISSTNSNAASNSGAATDNTGSGFGSPSIPSGTSPTNSIPPSQSSASTSAPTSAHHLTPKIIGGAIGGAVFLVLAAILILIKRRHSHEQDSLQTGSTVTPFLEGQPPDRVPHTAGIFGLGNPSATECARRKYQASKARDTNDSERQESPVNMSFARNEFNRMRFGNLKLQQRLMVFLLRLAGTEVLEDQNQNRTERRVGSRDQAIAVPAVYVDSGWRMPTGHAQAQGDDEAAELGYSDIVSIPPPHYTEI